VNLGGRSALSPSRVAPALPYHPPPGSGITEPVHLPPSLKAEVVELLARALLRDARQFPDLTTGDVVAPSTGAPPRGSVDQASDQAKPRHVPAASRPRKPRRRPA
jgi:hypothetical protein